MGHHETEINGKTEPLTEITITTSIHVYLFFFYLSVFISQRESHGVKRSRRRAAAASEASPRRYVPPH